MAFVRMSALLPAAYAANEFACTWSLQKRGQVSVRVNPPIFMSLLHGRRMTVLALPAFQSVTHSFHPHIECIT